MWTTAKMLPLQNFRLNFITVCTYNINHQGAGGWGWGGIQNKSDFSITRANVSLPSEHEAAAEHGTRGWGQRPAPESLTDLCAPAQLERMAAPRLPPAEPPARGSAAGGTLGPAAPGTVPLPAPPQRRSAARSARRGPLRPLARSSPCGFGAPRRPRPPARTRAGPRWERGTRGGRAPHPAALPGEQGGEREPEQVQRGVQSAFCGCAGAIGAEGAMAAGAGSLARSCHAGPARLRQTCVYPYPG